MNRQDIVETSSIQNAYDEIERLDKLFIEAFGKNTKCEMSIYTVGEVKDGTRRYGVTLYWDNKNEKEAEFFKSQYTINK